MGSSSTVDILVVELRLILALLELLFNAGRVVAAVLAGVGFRGDLNCLFKSACFEGALIFAIDTVAFLVDCPALPLAAAVSFDTIALGRFA